MLKTDWYKKAWTKPHFWPLQWTDVRPKCMPVCVCARVHWRILEEKSGGGLDSNNGGLLADGVCTALAKWSVFRHYYPTMCVSTVNADSYDKKWGSTIWQAPLSKKWGGGHEPHGPLEVYAYVKSLWRLLALSSVGWACDVGLYGRLKHSGTLNIGLAHCTYLDIALFDCLVQPLNRDAVLLHCDAMLCRCIYMNHKDTSSTAALRCTSSTLTRGR